MDAKELGREHGLGWSGSGLEQLAGCCECSSELTISKKCAKFIE
jgi:hypothetical protein